MSIHTILKDKGDHVVTVPVDSSIGAVAKVLAKEKIGAALVVDADGKMCGVISERDIVRGLGAHGASVLEQGVDTLMTADVICCAPGDSVNSVMARMTDLHIRHLPVFEGDKLLGVVSIGDVVKHRIEEIESEANALREYIAS